MKIAQNITELIGNTPLLKLSSFSKDANILGKCEFLNPSSSVKDRIAYNMIKTAMQENKINENSTIIEPTSGNTGIGLAMVCASMNLKLILTMPSSMSIERQKLLKALGATLVLTEPTLGMKGAISKAQELAQSEKNSFIPQQFSNQANPQMHFNTTAKEIWKATNGKVDIFVSAVGTGGTLSGIGKFLKQQNKNIKIFAVEPDKSAVLNGQSAGAHKIQGIGAGFIPDTLDTSLYEKAITVSFEDAANTSRTLAKKDGVLVGISAGANVYASSLLAKEFPNSNIVTILCDTAERYLSTELFA